MLRLEFPGGQAGSRDMEGLMEKHNTANTHSNLSDKSLFHSLAVRAYEWTFEDYVETVTGCDCNRGNQKDHNYRHFPVRVG
jgi:hypothetical protein